MKTILLFVLLAGLSISCSNDDKNCDCMGEFYNENTGQTEFVETDCDRTPPGDGFVFVGCADETE